MLSIQTCTFVSEYAEGKKVKFATTTLQGPALIWWNAKVATMGLETVNQMPWAKTKQLMTTEFCLIEELQRMEHEIWNLKVSSVSLPVCEHCFTRHVGQCTIKFHKCGKVGHKARYCKEKNVATGAHAQPILTCYDCVNHLVEIDLLPIELGTFDVIIEGKKVKFAATIMQEPVLIYLNAKVATIGLTDNIKGEVTSSKPANLNEAVRMAHKLMEQKSQAKDEGILEGKKRKWENFKSGNSSVSSRSLHVCEHFFTRHVGQCTIKCHKCGKVGHKARYCKEKNVATGANAQPILTCYDCGEQGHIRNRCPKKFKKEETKEVRG
uniref:CCHC-type domain-containing protein n=1 Tax=Tanacetum cinerariifolium TaxID=118510 RepID=A0A699I2G2_TANCI|nr:hypothetical protein [Tanacetum cinerariifolium]